MRTRASSPSSAGWACSKQWEGVVTPSAATSVTLPPARRVWVWALVPLVLLAALIAAIVQLEPGARLRPEGMPPVERLKIERATLASDGIHLAVMHDGPDAVTLAQTHVGE